MQAMPASRASGQHAWTRSKAMERTLARLSQPHLQSGLARVSGLTRAQLPRSPDLELLASDFWVNLGAESGLPASRLHPFGTQKFPSTPRKPSFSEVLLLILVIPGIKGEKYLVWLQALFRVPMLRPHITLHTLESISETHTPIGRRCFEPSVYSRPLSPLRGDHAYRRACSPYENSPAAPWPPPPTVSNIHHRITTLPCLDDTWTINFWLLYLHTIMKLSLT